jgi:hypothetical protein
MATGVVGVSGRRTAGMTTRMAVRIAVVERRTAVVGGTAGVTVVIGHGFVLSTHLRRRSVSRFRLVVRSIRFRGSGGEIEEPGKRDDGASQPEDDTQLLE